MGAHSSTIDCSNFEEATAKKMGAVTGVREVSEVEAMIQRYLELAHSALKEDDALSQSYRNNKRSK